MWNRAAALTAACLISMGGSALAAEPAAAPEAAQPALDSAAPVALIPSATDLAAAETKAPTVTTEPKKPARKSLRSLGTGFLVTGVLVGAAGATMTGFGTTQGDDLTVAGVTLASAGGAAVVTGIMVLIYDKVADDSVGVGAGPTDSGANLTFYGTF